MPSVRWVRVALEGPQAPVVVQLPQRFGPLMGQAEERQGDREHQDKHQHYQQPQRAPPGDDAAQEGTEHADEHDDDGELAAVDESEDTPLPLPCQACSRVCTGLKCAAAGRRALAPSTAAAGAGVIAR